MLSVLSLQKRWARLHLAPSEKHKKSDSFIKFFFLTAKLLKIVENRNISSIIFVYPRYFLYFCTHNCERAPKLGRAQIKIRKINNNKNNDS